MLILTAPKFNRDLLQAQYELQSDTFFRRLLIDRI